MVAVTTRSLALLSPPTVAPVLPDGTYDVFVVEATSEGPGDRLRLDVTIVAGEQKGEVVSVRAEGLGLSEIHALGSPGTLRVTGGEPTLTLE